ncbi:lipoxygenase family protein [Variovorax saccharolyticus]|uniref:lipoxygenase family protein n=1 Tax=Variovorax saccharolyticus TaxID=3053516 RepID=UPI00257506F4|nr:lipoxygenase family protein [Variovorax sp. J31P216]MDM0026480.1 lipoxygenase family protein [Variovorax sp. J31P216]
MNASIPTLPSSSTDAQTEARALQLSLSRTAYNYVRSYPNLDAVPMCAGVPAGEEFSAAYNALVAQTSAEIAENFAVNVLNFLEKEFQEDWVGGFSKLFQIRQDVQKLIDGMYAAAEEAVQEGPTAILKSTLFDMVRSKFLQAETEADYEKLVVTLPKPQMMAIESKDWMRLEDGRPCQQDWFFGYLQVAGFNTTNLRRVVHDKPTGSKALVWRELQAKMTIPDTVTVESLGGPTTLKLSDMVAAGTLYACDYAALIGDGDLSSKESDLHGKHRYLPSPIALFYWNASPPTGYPPVYGAGHGHAGALQPIAIQLGQVPGSAIFSPTDAFGANDADRLKWKIAKYFVNVACAIQHESVAHLGDCHLIMEAVAIATHRQLAKEHPLFQLLAPHLRFTISINDGASHNLIVPGGVVAANVGARIDWTLQMVNEARKAWRWGENSPDTIFSLRGMDQLADYPFRDDTLLLWKAIQDFVADYVKIYYKDDAAVASDPELMAWVQELGSPQHGNLSGFPTTLGTREQLAQVVAQMIYTAGPLHASVNYGQYPFAGFAPSVAAAIYKAAPTREDKIDRASQVLEWLPPLDVALYTVSFVYLLSSVQFDALGHYAANPQYPHFADPGAQKALESFQAALAQAEITIHQRNLERPIPYLFQVPSRVPNSISI